jgi:hypothetical protein
MINDDKQGAVPFSPQERELELEEHTLEGITGGASFKNFLKSCVACGTPNVIEDTLPDNHVFTVVKTKGVNKRQQMVQAQEGARRLESASGIKHSVVQQGRNIYIVKG